MEVPKAEHRLPEVPIEGTAPVLSGRVVNAQSGVRVSQLVAIGPTGVNVQGCQIRINHGKGDKDRQVPFPLSSVLKNSKW